MNEKTYDPVNSPEHYTHGNIECIDAMLDNFGIEAVEDFCLCNAFKYIWRAGRKNGIEDLKKAVWYLNKIIAREEKPVIKPADSPTMTPVASSATPQHPPKKTGIAKTAPKEKQTAPEPPIDHGKIIALHKAGRSVSWIADEMQCTPQTVRNHINREKEDKGNGDVLPKGEKS